MKTVLILGAIESFCDLITDIQSMGIITVVCDYYPDAPGKKLADYSYNISTTDIDSLVNIGKKHSIDGVICAFSDRNLYSCYMIAKKLNLPTFYTPEIIDVLTDKIKMKTLFKNIDIPIIKYAIIQKDFNKETLYDFEYPVIIKPIDSSGSKGCFVCTSFEEVKQMFPLCLKENVNNTTDIIIEEFYQADEVSVTAWIKNGKSYITCIYDVGKNYGENIVTNSIIFPSKYTDKYLYEINNYIQKITDSLNIIEGPVTLQCFLGEKGIKVIEYIYRLAGGSPYMFTEYLGGPNLAKMLVEYSINKKINYSNLETFYADTKRTIYQFRIYATSPTKIFYTFNEESIKKAIPECTYFHIYTPSGTSFSTIPTDGKIVARLFCEVNDPKVQTFESFIDILEEVAIITNENGENITSYNRPINLPQYTIREVINDPDKQ